MTVGTRAQVWHGTADRTAGGLTKKDLFMKNGRIRSKRASRSAKNNKNLKKAGWTFKKGEFGAVRVDEKEGEGKKRTARRSAKRSAKRSARRSAKRSAGRVARRSARRSAGRVARRSAKRSARRSARRSAGRVARRRQSGGRSTGDWSDKYDEKLMTTQKNHCLGAANLGGPGNEGLATVKDDALSREKWKTGKCGAKTMPGRERSDSVKWNQHKGLG